jgi:hypothetical protein
VLTALASPARYLEAGQERNVRWPWEATVPLEVDGETFEAYPNRDSLPFLARYGFPAHWRTATFIRGTLRLDGWRAAWKPVFEVLRSEDGARVAALAEDLRARYSMTDSDRDRVVLSVSLTLAEGDGPGWQGRYLLDVTGDASETAMARLVSLPLACGVSEILSGGLPAGLHRAAHGADEAARWLAFLSRHGTEPKLEVAEMGDGP